MPFLVKCCTGINFALSYKEQKVNDISIKVTRESRQMNIDGPMLMGFAAILTSVTNLVSVIVRIRSGRQESFGKARIRHPEGSTYGRQRQFSKGEPFK